MAKGLQNKKCTFLHSVCVLVYVCCWVCVFVCVFTKPSYCENKILQEHALREASLSTNKQRLLSQNQKMSKKDIFSQYSSFSFLTVLLQFLLDSFKSLKIYIKSLHSFCLKIIICWHKCYNVKKFGSRYWDIGKNWEVEPNNDNSILHILADKYDLNNSTLKQISEKGVKLYCFEVWKRQWQFYSYFQIWWLTFLHVTRIACLLKEIGFILGYLWKQLDKNNSP